MLNLIDSIIQKLNTKNEPSPTSSSMNQGDILTVKDDHLNSNDAIKTES